MSAWSLAWDCGVLRAICAGWALALCAGLAMAQERADEQPLGQVAISPEDRAAVESPGATASPFKNEEPLWLPQWTLPHPDLYEELWHPGTLVDDTYWLRRPWSAGVFVGTMDGGDPTSRIRESSDWYWGVRFGNDFAPHWGWEFRSAFFSPSLVFEPSWAGGGIVNDWFLDMNVLHYPWGDTRVRPYWSIGLGAVQYKFANAFDSRASEWTTSLPLAIGCKYYVSPCIAIRGELGDTISFDNGTVDGMHHLSLNIGAELHWHSFKTRPIRYSY